MTKKAEKKTSAAKVKTAGIKAADFAPVGAEVLERARAEWRKTSALEMARKRQTLEFDEGPIGLAFVADQHLGNHGTDYDRAFGDAKVVSETDGLWAVSMGDIVDNFIIMKLAHARASSHITVPEEWALAKEYMTLLGPKLLAAVGGNHDFWTARLAGIDYFADMLAQVNPDALYDQDDSLITISVAGVKWRSRLRHKWQGNSIYNPTHGVERSHKWDQDFELGVGGHTHASGLARPFNAAGRDGLAVLCGSYKRVDHYARQSGFAKPNTSAAVVVIFDPVSQTMQGFNDLGLAVRTLTALRAHGKDRTAKGAGRKVRN